MQYTNGDVTVSAIQYTGNNVEAIKEFCKGRCRSVLANNDSIKMAVDGKHVQTDRFGFIIESEGTIFAESRDEFLSNFRRV